MLRIVCALAAAAAVTGVALPSLAQSAAPGTTDLTMAETRAIESNDIVEALAVPRGTRIRPNARPKVQLPVYFEFNSAELRADARDLLAKVASALRSDDLEGFQFSVEGHTDSIGTEETNHWLSQERAKAVKQFLVAQGVPRERLETTGHGESQPVAPNDDALGRQRNRRVDFVNMGATE